MVRGHLIAAAALSLAAASAWAQAVAPVGQAGAGTPRSMSATRRATAPGADPAQDAAAPHSAKGKGKTARSAKSKLMPSKTTHDIMMPHSDPK